jgi:hypothetical protein
MLPLSWIWQLQSWQVQPLPLIQGHNWSGRNQLRESINAISMPLFQLIWIRLILGFLSKTIKLNSYLWSSWSFISFITGAWLTFRLIDFELDYKRVVDIFHSNKKCLEYDQIRQHCNHISLYSSHYRNSYVEFVRIQTNEVVHPLARVR